jgi:acetyl/propionyl-CoA carboxylase alpha subunit
MSGDTLKISGKRFVLESSPEAQGWKFESRPGGWILATHTGGARIRMSGMEARGKLSFSLPSGVGFGEVLAKSHASGAGSAASVESDLTAQFPGKVRKVLVTPGSQVAQGDSLILVEAMKMEFAIKAPVAGRVTRVLVIEGQQLSPGDRFVDFECEEASK